MGRLNTGHIHAGVSAEIMTFFQVVFEPGVTMVMIDMPVIVFIMVTIGCSDVGAVFQETLIWVARERPLWLFRLEDFVALQTLTRCSSRHGNSVQKYFLSLSVHRVSWHLAAECGSASK